MKRYYYLCEYSDYPENPQFTYIELDEDIGLKEAKDGLKEIEGINKRIFKHFSIKLIEGKIC